MSICLACTWVLVLGLTPMATAAPADAALAPADPADIPHIEDASTVPVYDYGEAIRESLYVETELDSDADGQRDLVRVDVIRPREAAEAGIAVPSIMVASPYYHCCGRGAESERKVYGDDGVPVKFPLYYDNYFVPRGYAIVQVDLMGTANSQGCMDVGGNAEVGSATAAIDWLNGRAVGYDLDGNPVSADWSSGKVGMIGKSWDGSVANGAAATGIDGLETIVPIGAISSWYYYTRASGTIISRGYADFLHRYVSGRPASACAHMRQHLISGSDDATANYNEFWAERDYVKDADKVKASVFVVHGLGDTNVKMINVGPWWDALAANGVPRKIWLTQTGHEEPFDFRRAEWVDTLHDWFDYWLQGLDNGIMREPMATVEQQSGRYVDEATWPARGSRHVSLNLSGPADEGRGAMTLRAEPKAGTIAYSGSTGTNVLTFSSAELRDAVRLSGTPELTLRVKVDRPTRAIRARLVEHGEDLEVTRSTVTRLDTQSCWGQSTAEDDACYWDTTTTTYRATNRQITFGDADIAHWRSLSELTPVGPEEWVDVTFPLNTTDALIDAGNRIAIELRAGSPNYTALASGGATIEVDLARSSVKLPIAGGLNGLADPGPRPERRADAPGRQPTLQELVEEFN